MRSPTLTAVLAFVTATSAGAPRLALAQAPAVAPPSPPHRIVISTLVNQADGAALDFQGGECEVDTDGRAMTCEFQQVFLTASPLDANTCLVTTNRYVRRFQQTAARIWLSRDEPVGACGVEEQATLTDEGDGRRWSLEQRKVVTRPEAAGCKAPAPAPEVLSWRNARRPLPCRFVQPGALR